MTIQAIPKKSFLLACKIYEQGNPSIAHEMIGNQDRNVESLIKLNALKMSKKLWIQDEDGEYKDIYYQNKKAGFFDKNDNFTEVCPDYVCSYKLSPSWIVKAISDNLGVSNYSYETLIKDYFWQVGVLNHEIKIPIFFVRGIHHKDILSQIYNIFKNRKGIARSVILSSSSFLPPRSSFKDGHKIITLKDCLIHDNDNFSLDKNVIISQVENEKSSIRRKQREGFSKGYRSANFNGENFKFSKQEADVLEFLDGAGKPIHKDEIAVEISDNIAELKFLFRNPDSKSIRQNILKYDNKGYYWLDY